LIVDAILDMLARLIAEGGGQVKDRRADANLFDQSPTDADAVIAIGGTGVGRNDGMVRSLARHGHVEVHGIAISPGETAGLGFIDRCPVLLAPARLDAVLAVWLLIGRHLTTKLAGGVVHDLPAMLPLKRKVSSVLGLAELVPMACSAGMAEPLASGYLSLTALARSDGWIAVPPESEGFAVGTQVAVREWP
jgi:molybdopterin biosynthesis enzyme